MADSSGSRDSLTSNAPTVTFSSPDMTTATVAQRGRRGKVEIVQGPQTCVETASARLLRHRLRAGAIVVCIGFGLFLIRSFFIPRPLQGFHTLVVFASGVCVALLSAPRSYSLKQLRFFELAVFGLPVAFFVPYQHFFMLFEADKGSAALTLAAFKSVALYWLVTMVFYGLIVPNDWRRAAWIIVPMTFVPPGVALFTRGYNELAAEVITFDQWSDVQIVLIVGAVCSIYGTHIMNNLRIEASEAREMGQYRLLRPIGEGGMGQVYLAEHRLLKRPSAIKLIHPKQAGDPNALARFEREVRASAKLTHWNTIDIYDYGRTEDGTFYYVMEYLAGLNLQQLTLTHGPQPPARVVHLIRQLCYALREAHREGLIHRDIKPSNAIVTIRGGVYDIIKLLDFGLVKPVADFQAAQLTQAGTITGTPKYIAPEQFTGKSPPDARSDIYAVGAVAYVLLTGHAPFEKDSVAETIAAHLHELVRPPSSFRPEMPSDLQAVVLKCLEKDPDDRYPCADELEHALSECACADQWSQFEAEQWWSERHFPGFDGSLQSKPLETATPS